MFQISHCLYPTNVELRKVTGEKENFKEYKNSEFSLNSSRTIRKKNSNDGVKNWKKELLKLKKSQFLQKKKSSSIGPFENIMLSTFQINSKKIMYKSPSQTKKIGRKVKNKLRNKKNYLSKLDLKSISGPYLGLAECQSSSPYK
mmetsp:Transcript_4711/g.3968  ORF Transcript_4711/g.3968 Transcript_4711/m.3968 type:complete len:144 (-) Transcript_4711:498-929(-)